MSILRKFNKAFGVEADLEEEKLRFVQRINQSILTPMRRGLAHPDEYEVLFRGICYELGIDPDPLIADANHMNYGYERRIPPLTSLTQDDFHETLKILTISHDLLNGADNIAYLDHFVQMALAMSIADLGVRWKDGMFYPSGAKELDEKLIEDNLAWLHAFPKVRSQFGTALEHFGKSLSDPAARKDAMTNAYSAMEQLARDVLNNQKRFDDNAKEIVQYLGLPREYGSILTQYRQMAHEFSSRHAGSEWGHTETESFVYLTGLLMRLICEKASVSEQS